MAAVRLTDDQARKVIKQHFDGLSIAYLAERTGFSDGCIKAICTGVNRSHLLREVEEEMRKAKRVMG